jgi:hypothetical protein
MTRNLAPKIEMTLLMRIFAVVKPVVHVDFLLDTKYDRPLRLICCVLFLLCGP